MPTLYKLTENYNNILALVGDESIPDYEIADALKVLDADIETKCSNGIGLLQQIKAYESAVDAEIKRLQSVKKMFAGRVKTIEKIYVDGLTAIDKAETGIMTERGLMKVKKNPPAVIIDDVAKIPTQYMRQKVEIAPDKAAIKAALKSGEIIEGAHIEQGVSLSY